MDLRLDDYKAKLMREGCYMLGGGAYGAVYGNDALPDTAIKVSHESYAIGESYLQWAAWAGYAGSFAPVVHRFEHFRPEEGQRYWVQTGERLDTTVWGLRRPDEYMARQIGSALLCYWPTADHTDNAALDYCEKHWPGFNGFCVMAERAGYGYDWSSSNWMLNKDRSRLVLTDPMADIERVSTRVSAKVWSTAGNREIVTLAQW